MFPFSLFKEQMLPGCQSSYSDFRCGKFANSQSVGKVCVVCIVCLCMLMVYPKCTECLLKVFNICASQNPYMEYEQFIFGISACFNCWRCKLRRFQSQQRFFFFFFPVVSGQHYRWSQGFSLNIWILELYPI